MGSRGCPAARRCPDGCAARARGATAPAQASRRQADARDLRLRPGRRDRRTSSRTTRTGTTSTGRRGCRTFANQFGEDGHFYLSAAPEPFRRQGRAADGQRTTSRRQFEFDMFGVGARRRADDDPPAPCVGPVEADRRRTDQQPVHGRGRLPERRSTTGARTGCCSSATSQVFWEPYRGRRFERAHRDRESGRERRRRRARRPRRAAEREGALPVAGLHRPLSLGRPEVGLRAGRRRPPLHRVRRHASERPVRSERPRLGLGRQPQLEREGRASNDVLRLQARLRRGHRELLQRRADRRRASRRNPGNAVTPVVGEALPDFGLVVYLDHNWNEQVVDARSATRASTSQQRRPGGRTRTRSASTRAATCWSRPRRT